MASSKKVGRPSTKQPISPSGGFFSNIRWGESYVSLLLGAIVVIVAAALGLFYVKFHQPKEEILPPAQIARVLTVSPSASISAYPTAFPSPTAKPLSPTKSPTPTQKSSINSNSTVTTIPTKTPQQQGQKTYIVQKNDDLWNIAIKEYGSGYSWVSIAQANHLANPGRIYAGDTLIIPSVTPIFVQNTVNQQATPTPTVKQIQPKITVTPTPSASSTGSGTTANNAITGITYTVQKGDTLWSIAVRAYGDGYKWVNIAKANNLTNPSVIHSGNVLIIPRKQTL